MPFVVDIAHAKNQFPEYNFIAPLTPSEQKAAFHVKDAAGKDLCLKIINPNYDIDRLNREILALQTVNHPNVVKLVNYTFSSTPGCQKHYMVEEFVTGCDLTNKIIKNQPWLRSDAAELFSYIADGLAALKSLNIVHRDLKPNNIRVRSDNSPIIIDFGLARHLDLPDLTKTHEGAAIGTPAYFSPEQIKGNKHDIDHRTDLFALGIILYEVVVGSHPFLKAGMTRADLENAICTSEDHSNKKEFSSLPKNWKTLISKLLSKERVKRPSHAEQVAKILRKIKGDQ